MKFYFTNFINIKLFIIFKFIIIIIYTVRKSEVRTNTATQPAATSLRASL